MPATEVINLRIGAEQKALIDRAAGLAGQNRTAFILEHALHSAEQLLLEQTRFNLPDEQWEAFNKALDEPVGPNAALETLLATPAPWEREETC